MRRNAENLGILPLSDWMTKLMIAVVITSSAFLSGCPEDDYGSGQWCECEMDLVSLAFTPPCGGMVTPIQLDSPTFLVASPGQIIRFIAMGGGDADFRFDEVVDPLDGCSGGCGPEQTCFYAYGDADQTCVVWVDNRNADYMWSIEGECVKSYEFDPLESKKVSCYIEVDPEYSGAATTFTVTISRVGASVAECSGENYATSSFIVNVIPVPQYTLSVITSAGAASLLVSGPDEEGSVDLREDKAQFQSPNTLKDRFVEQADASVCVDYRVSAQYVSNLVPINWDATNTWLPLLLELIVESGFDLVICNHIYTDDNPPPPAGPEFSGVLGRAWNDYGLYNEDDGIVLSALEITDVKKTFIHEIGHCSGPGLGDNMILRNYNIMINGLFPEYLKGMDVSSLYSQHITLSLGSEGWHD